MVGANFDTVCKRNGVQLTELIDQLGGMTKAVARTGLNSFAMQVIGHIEDRVYAYIHDLRLLDRKVASL